MSLGFVMEEEVGSSEVSIGTDDNVDVKLVAYKQTFDGFRASLQKYVWTTSIDEDPQNNNQHCTSNSLCRRLAFPLLALTLKL